MRIVPVSSVILIILLLSSGCSSTQPFFTGKGVTNPPDMDIRVAEIRWRVELPNGKTAPMARVIFRNLSDNPKWINKAFPGNEAHAEYLPDWQNTGKYSVNYGSSALTVPRRAVLKDHVWTLDRFDTIPPGQTVEILCRIPHIPKNSSVIVTITGTVYNSLPVQGDGSVVPGKPQEYRVVLWHEPGKK